jgi:hypothetical protein
MFSAKEVNDLAMDALMAAQRRGLLIAGLRDHTTHSLSPHTYRKLIVLVVPEELLPVKEPSRRFVCKIGSEDTVLPGKDCVRDVFPRDGDYLKAVLRIGGSV